MESSIPIGAHSRGDRPVVEAEERKGDLIQMFLGPPQSWKPPPERSDADELAAGHLPIYVHAPYPINVGSDNNRIRIPSRKTLAQSVVAAEQIGAEAVIVHGGHLGDDEGFDLAGERWRKAIEPLESDLLIIIENTAGGENAIAREIDKYGPLWEEIGDLRVGTCLDTCHAWSAGEDMETVVDRLVEATGRIDLVHCNDSRDPHDSRRDRHANLGQGQIPEEIMVGVVRSAGVPVVVETPGGASEQAADIAWLRARL